MFYFFRRQAPQTETLLPVSCVQIHYVCIHYCTLCVYTIVHYVSRVCKYTMQA